MIINLNDYNNINIPENITSLVLKNASDDNFYTFKIPEHVHELEICGTMKKLIIPDHVTDIICSFMNLEELHIGDKVEYLYCNDNNLTTVYLPETLLAADISDNKINKIIIKNELKYIQYLYVQNNQIEDFDIRLPQTMAWFDMDNNPNMKIKYLNFVFGGSEIFNIIEGDFDRVLCNNQLINKEHIRARLFDACNAGNTYIDINRLKKDKYFYSLVKD